MSDEASPAPASAARPTAEDPRPLISVLIASRNRPGELAKAIQSVLDQDYASPFEIVVLDDDSDTPLEQQIASELPSNRVQWLRSDSPSGVSGARNRLVGSASGELLVFLDDDAWFVGTDELQKIERTFDSQPELGVLAFKIHLGEVGSSELQVPFTRRALKADPQLADRARQVSYFVGAGHVIRRQVFERCGPYPEEFVYGHEELDLSYRAIDSGFTLLYDPSIEIVHAPAASQVAGGGKKRFESYYVTRNRLWLAHRNLPWRYAVVYSLAWSGYYLLQSLRHRQLRSWLAAIRDGIFRRNRSERRPISKQARDYLARNHGRLWR